MDLASKVEDNTTQIGTTAALASRLTGLVWSDVTPEAVTVAKQCLLDWLGVSIAARDEPLVQILKDEFAEGGESTVIGSARRARLHDAVLINGACSHALDFDDVITAMNGHPTVPVAPVAIGLAEVLGSSGRELLLAFIAGVETECRVGRLLGPSHYAKGWHATATFGTFGAMAAAAKLLGLNDEQTRHAFGLAGTQAAGLKSVFGTMSKPLHAGKAAQNGLMAARLASRGFTSDTEILDSDQGFAAVQSTAANRQAALAEPSQLFYVADALFKYHAACYLTHNAIEAAGKLRGAHDLDPAEVEAVRVHVNAGHMGVCNIAEPRTGLECKFSLRMTTALALAGEDTFEEALFSDATATRADLVALRRRVSVIPDAAGPGSTVEIALKDGRTLTETVDVARPVRDLDAQQAQLERKFRHLAEPALGPAAATQIIDICRTLEAAPDLAGLLTLCRP
ncbi:MAG TPA: MmgE/PrpD family protein [Caulobacteraceae bacterium]